MAEIKKVKASTLPDITDLTGYKVFGIKKNVDGTVDNGLITTDLLAGSVLAEISGEIIQSVAVNDVTVYNEIII